MACRVGWYRLTLSLGTLAKWHNLLLSNLSLPLLVSFQVEWGEGILSNLSLTLPFLVSFQGHRRRCLICLIQFVFVFIDEFSGRMGRYFIQFVFVSDVLSHLSLSLLMRFQVESRWVLICFYPIPKSRSLFLIIDPESRFPTSPTIDYADADNDSESWQWHGVACREGEMADACCYGRRSLPICRPSPSTPCHLSTLPSTPCPGDSSDIAPSVFPASSSRLLYANLCAIYAAIFNKYAAVSLAINCKLVSDELTGWALNKWIPFLFGTSCYHQATSGPCTASWWSIESQMANWKL